MQEFGIDAQAAENIRKFFEEEEGARMLEIFDRNGLTVWIQLMGQPEFFDIEDVIYEG